MKRTPLKRSSKVWGSVRKGRDPVRYASTALKRAVMERDGWLCHWCGRPVTMETGVADHMRPWKLGGPTKLANLVAACANCNRLHANQEDWHGPSPS